MDDNIGGQCRQHGYTSTHESTKAIAAGAWSGFFLAVILFLAQRILNPAEIARAAFSSTRALSFAILALVLIFMPSGLLGKPEIEKV